VACSGVSTSAACDATITSDSAPKWQGSSAAIASMVGVAIASATSRRRRAPTGALAPRLKRDRKAGVSDQPQQEAGAWQVAGIDQRGDEDDHQQAVADQPQGEGDAHDSIAYASSSPRACARSHGCAGA